MKSPTSAEKTSLVEAARKNYGASVSNAPLSVQQRFYTALRKKIDSLAAKYPHIDLSSSDFQDRLTREARSAWERSAIRGAGKDW